MAATELEVFSNGADYAVLYPPGEVEWSGTINSVMLNGNEWSLFSLEQDAIEVEGEAPPSIILWNLSPETEYTLQLVGGIFNQPLYEATFTTLASNFQTVANVGATSPSVGVVFVSFDLVGEGIVPSTIVEVGNTGLQPTNLGNGAYGITFTNVPAGTDEVAVYVPTYYVNVYNGETLTYSRGENWVPAATTDYYASVTVLTNTPPTPVDPSSSSAGTSGVLQFFNVFGQNPWQMVNALAEIGKSVPFTNPWSSGLGSNYTQWDATCSVAVVPQPGVIYAQSIEEASAGSTYAKFKYEDTDTPIPYNNALAVEGDSGQAYRMYAVHFIVNLQGGGESGAVFDPLANIVATGGTGTNNFWGFAVYDHTNNALVELVSYAEGISAIANSGVGLSAGWVSTTADGVQEGQTGYVRNIVRTYIVPTAGTSGASGTSSSFDFDVSVAILSRGEYQTLAATKTAVNSNGETVVAFGCIGPTSGNTMTCLRLPGRAYTTQWVGTEPVDVTLNNVVEYTNYLFPGSSGQYLPFPASWYTCDTWELPFFKAYRFNNSLLKVLHVASNDPTALVAKGYTSVSKVFEGITGGSYIIGGETFGALAGPTAMATLHPPLAWLKYQVSQLGSGGFKGFFIHLFDLFMAILADIFDLLTDLFMFFDREIEDRIGDATDLLIDPLVGVALHEIDNVLSKYS